MNARMFNAIWPPAMVFAASMIIAEAVVRLGGVPAWLVPAPSSVMTAMYMHWDALGPALWSTTEATTLGFALSIVVGVLLAIVLSTARWVQRAFYPYAIFFQTVPIVAVAPLLVIWCGYGLQTVVVTAFIVSVFPVIANTLSGLLAVDPALADLFQLYGARRWATLWKLKLPAAMPSIFTGLRIAAGLAVIGAIVGEFFAGQGLGNIIDESRRARNTDRVFAAILLASLLGLAFFGLVNLASHMALRRWHASERRS